MRPFEFVLGRGTWTDADIENEHLASLQWNGQAAVRVASLETVEDVERETRHADGVIVSTNPLPRSLIERLGPDVRIIARAGIGLDAIDLDAAAERGIAVFHTPEYATKEVATHAVALMLAVNRKIVQADELARRNWAGWKVMAPIQPFTELTAGVVGAGRIGRTIAQLLQMLVNRVLIFDPYVDEVPLNTEKEESLDVLLSESDIITLHMPLTEETRSMIGRRELNLLKRGAGIVNVSRGPLIDEAALVEALKDGHLGGAGLDVLETEPPATESPILSAPNVTLSPHVAWYSVASERRTRIMALEGMIDYLQGRPPRAGRLAVIPEPAVGTT